MLLKNFRITTGSVKDSVNIIQEASRWLVNLNMPLWKQEELTEEKLLNNVEPKNFCVGWIGNESAATMILQWYDPIYWPDIKQNQSGFIHKFCVRRKYAGSGVTKRMLEYAIQKCQEIGIDYLRLDTAADRRNLCKFYEGLGFIQVGRKKIEDTEYALYELKIKTKQNKK